MKRKFLFLGLTFLFLIDLTAQYEADFSARADLLIEQIADNYKSGDALPSDKEGISGDPEKYWWPLAIARFEKYGVSDQRGNDIVGAFSEHDPFHFTFVGMARIMLNYPTADSMSYYEYDYLEEVWERTDNYNAWTGEGTENHLNMSRTSGYLYAQVADANHSGTINDADTKMAQMKTWIMDYSNAIYNHGTAEWNSTQYEAYNILGWLNLYDFADDPEVKAAAQAVLDYYAASMALYWSWGTLGAGEMRASKGADKNWRESADYLGWLWFSEDTDAPAVGWSGNEYIQSIHAATSSYRPPDYCIDLAQKNVTMPQWYQNSQSSYLFADTSLVKHSYYMDEGFTMGSTVSKYGGYTYGTFAIIPWKLIIEANSGYPYTISGNGRTNWNTSARGINPYTQITQHENVLILMTNSPDNAKTNIWDPVFDKCGVVKPGGNWETDWSNTDGWSAKWETDFDIRFPEGGIEGNPDKSAISPVCNGFSEDNDYNDSYLNLNGLDAAKYNTNGKYLVADYDNAYLGVYFFNSNAQNLAASGSRGQVYDTAAVGTMSGFLIEVQPKGEYASLAAFETAFTGRTISVNTTSAEVSYTMEDETVLNATYETDGEFTEAIFDWGWGPTVRDLAMHANPTQRFFQPDWGSVIGTSGVGRIPSFSIDGNTVDYNALWDVFNGPDVKLQGEVLTIGQGDSAYNVDYTGSVPAFTTGPTTIEDQIAGDVIPEDISVYPVPSSGEVNISGDIVNGKLELINSSGIIVQQETLNENVKSMNIENKGVYILKIEKDGTLMTKKILIK